MPPQLSHARAKLKRAREHVNDFHRLKVLFRESYAKKVIAQFDVKANRTTFRVGDAPIIPAPFAFIVGDAVHNFRSALDHLAFALFKDVNPGKSGSHIYFPIGKDVADYKSQSPRKTEGIPKTITDRIDAFCPYGGEPLPNMLWALHKLDIMDKHQLLVPVATVNAGMMVSANGSEYALRTINLPQSNVLVPGDIVWEAVGNFEEDKNIDFVFDIAFGEPEILRGFSVAVAFGLISMQVENIIESFNR